MLRELSERNTKVKQCLKTTFLHDIQCPAGMEAFESDDFIMYVIFRAKFLVQLWNEREYLINSFLKGIIFAQDVHEKFRMDDFTEIGNEFFRFLYPKNTHYSLCVDTILFQGSASEGTCLFNETIIDNDTTHKDDVETSLTKIQSRKEFDIDIMHVIQEETRMAIPADCGASEYNIVYVRRIKDDSGLNPDCVQLKQNGIVMMPEFYLRQLVPSIFQKAEDLKSIDFDTFLCEARCKIDDILCLKCKVKNSKLIKKRSLESFVNIESLGFTGPAITCSLRIKTQAKEKINTMETLKPSNWHGLTENNLHNVSLSDESFPWISQEGITFISIDHVPGLPFPHSEFGGSNGGRWPLWALEYFSRNRPSEWPPTHMLYKITQDGCHVVPKKGDCAFDNLKGFSTRDDPNFRNFNGNPFVDPTWRVSFSQAEKTLASSFNEVQRRCFLFSKFILNQHEKEKNNDRNFFGGISGPLHKDCIFESDFTSYMLKHVFFWVMEETPAIQWRENNMLECIILVLKKFISFVLRVHIPHYFLGEKKNLLDPPVRANSLHYEEQDLTVIWHRFKKFQSLLFSKLVSTAKHLRLFIFSSIVYGIRNNEFDSIWAKNLFYQKEHDLHNTFEEFVLALTSPQPEDIFKEKVIDHYQNVLEFIESAPFVYGTGVNKSRVQFISDELQHLKKHDLSELDEFERQKIQQRFRTKVHVAADDKVDDLVKLQLHALKQEKNSFGNLDLSHPEQLVEKIKRVPFFE